MNYRTLAYTLLQQLPYTVTSSRVDPFLSDDYPAINVRKTVEERTSLGSANWFDVKSEIAVSVATIATSDDKDEQLDTIVSEVCSKLFSDVDFSLSAGDIPKISTTYGYSKAGEFDLSVAVIKIELRYSEQFELNNEHERPLERIGVDINARQGSLKEYNPAKDLDAFDTGLEPSEAEQYIDELNNQANPYKPDEITQDGVIDRTILINVEQQT